jgi:two-component system, cell cycle response regulator DivK
MIPDPKRVLLVEDNSDNRYLSSVLLESAGFTVRCATTGSEALAAVAEEVFSMVLLDLQLPDVDGFEVARQIRTMAKGKDLPIIAVSAFAQATDRKRAFAAGCTGYLEKPIDAETFVAQVVCQAGTVVA